MIHQQVPFHHLRFPSPRQLSKHLPQVRTQLPIQRLPPILRDEYHMIFALPFRVCQTAVLLFHLSLLFVGLERFTIKETLTTPGDVKLWESPRPSRGFTILISTDRPLELCFPSAAQSATSHCPGLWHPLRRGPPHTHPRHQFPGQYTERLVGR